jgi:hypothetical protein
MSKDLSLLDHAAACIQRHAGVPGLLLYLLLLLVVEVVLRSDGLIAREVRPAAMHRAGSDEL